MTASVFTGDIHAGAVASNDRGLAYGDGLFETMRSHGGEVPWWDAHWSRLHRGAERLGIVLPAPARVHAEARRLLTGGSEVLKLLVTRGSGGRGYAPMRDASPTWVLSVHRIPPAAPAQGIVLRWCTTQLAVQPLFAGIKHCNRLEQVMARAEWNDPACRDADADEGLMRSVEGDVISATAANVFVFRDGRWRTPAVDRCGVAGVCRAWAMQNLDAVEARLDVTAVETAEAVFLCNAVRGILPAARLGDRTWLPHPQVTALRAMLAAAHPGFASDN